MHANGSASNGSDHPSSNATSVRGNIKDLFNSLAGYQTEQASNTHEAEQKIQAAFRDFLVKSNYRLALKNFDALLAEKSGDKAHRNDGTVNWYHELVPILMILEMAKKGKRNGGFNFKDAEKYGGLEVAIISHLRHDSAEDFISEEELREQMQGMCRELSVEDPNHDVGKCQRQIELSMKKIKLMTQQRLTNPDGSPVLRADGKQEKEDLLEFSHRMIDPEESDPFVVISKMADQTANAAALLGYYQRKKLADMATEGANNMSTMLRPPSKFTPQKIQDRLDRMENMYGRRFGIADHAQVIWPEFACAIEKLDNTMGMVMYPLFRYLENVELHYKQPSTHTMGLGTYLKPGPTAATSWNLARAFNPVEVSLMRMADSVDPADTEKFARNQEHMEMVIKRTLAPWKHHFTFLYEQANDNNEGASNASAPAPQHHSSVA